MAYVYYEDDGRMTPGCKDCPHWQDLCPDVEDDSGICRNLSIMACPYFQKKMAEIASRKNGKG